MHLRTRTILLAEVTFSPHSGWLEQQVRNVLWECEERGIQPRFLLHDRDKCFAGGFDVVLTHAGVEPIKTPYHAPNANSFAERWIRSAREECLRHLVLFGIKSLRRAVHTYRRFFNEKRPRQASATVCRAACEQVKLSPPAASVRSGGWNARSSSAVCLSRTAGKRPRWWPEPTAVARQTSAVSCHAHRAVFRLARNTLDPPPTRV